MSGSDTAPFLSQADDTDDGPVLGTPGLPGSMGNTKSEDSEVLDPEGLQRITGLSSGRSALIVAVLCYINLLNYMDRFTVAGVLPDIEQFFDIGDSSSGLIQTVFISSYMVLAPVFGYLGDRYNRKYLMCGGIAFWSLVTLGSSFIPRERFWLLLLTRGLVGVGEASYSTIAPTLIADLFVADHRSRMLSVFYFAIPVGSGLGYIAGSKVKDVAGDWHWALRVTPGLGVVAVLLLFLVVREPPRGAVERHSDSPPLNPTSWWADLRALARNASFILSSLGFTAVAFVTGSLALWAPAFLLRSRVVLGETPPCLPGESCSSSDSLLFGLITCLTGVLGVGLGVEISRRLRRSNPRADPLVCAAGLLGSAPFLFLSLACARGSIVATYVFIFIGETLLSMNWAIVADILLYVVIPTRRSTAEAFQIVLSHLLGDAGSPYLIGLISDRLRRGWPPSFLSEFRALQFSLMLCAFIGALGGAAFLGSAIFIEGDRRRAQLHVQGSYDSAASDSLAPSSILIKQPPTLAPWPPATSYPPVTSYPPLSQPDLLPILRSPQPPGSSYRMPSSRQDSDCANSVASYENEEPACEDEDEDEEEEDYPNEGYLEVLPDSAPATGTVVPVAPVPSNPGLRDSAFSRLLSFR